MATSAGATPKRRVELGPAESFPVGAFKIVPVGDLEIGIVRLADGRYRAVRNRCPHKGAPVCKGILGGTWPPSAVGELAFEREGRVLVCPWHGYEYDLETGVELFHENPTKLRMYETVVEADRLFVLL